MEITLGIILLVFAVFLIAAILLQSSKSHKLPGTIAGGAETFFGKTKGGKLDRLLGIATTVVAIIFCVIVIAMYVTQDTPMSDAQSQLSNIQIGADGSPLVSDTTAADATDSDAAEDTTASDTAADEAADTAVEDAAEADATDTTEAVSETTAA